MSEPTVVELRKVLASDQYSGLGWLITAYRTMAIRAGLWLCVCGSNHLNEDSGEMEDEIIVTEGDQDIVKCPSYRPEEL